MEIDEWIDISFKFLKFFRFYLCLKFVSTRLSIVERVENDWE